MLYRSTQCPEKIYVTIANLDAIDRALDGHVSYEEKVDWHQPGDGLPCYRGKSSQVINS